MIFELIKAAVFATTEHRGPERAKDHPIVVTMVDGPKELLIRISDEGALTPSFHPSFTYTH